MLRPFQIYLAWHRDHSKCYLAWQGRPGQNISAGHTDPAAQVNTVGNYQHYTQEYSKIQ